MKKSTLAGIITAVAIIAVAAIVVVNNKNHSGSVADTLGTSTNTSATDTNTDATANTNPDSTAQTGSDSSTSTAENNDSSVQTGEVQLDIKDYAYSQKTLKIKKGTTVTWTNRDSVGHDVMPDEKTAGFTGSEILSQGQSYSYTFNEVGTYAYHCSPHPYMTASVEVVE